MTSADPSPRCAPPMSSHPPTGWRDKEDCAFGNGWQSRAALASRSVMTDDEVIAEFRAADALLDGPFILSSGLRSPRYLDRKSVVVGKSVSVRVDLGGARIIKKKKKR